MEELKKLIKKPLGIKKLDSVKFHKDEQKGNSSERPKDLALLERAHDAWEAMDEVRRQRAREMRFAYGDQWADPITVTIDGHTRTMTMREYLSLEGHLPLQSNQIAAQVNTVVGVNVKEGNEPVCYARDRSEQQYGELLTCALQANLNKNRINKINKMIIKEICLGGIAAVKERYGFQGRREDSWTEFINPNYLILETTLRDPRFWDVEMIGCWYELSYQSLVTWFVKSKKDLEDLEKIYPGRENHQRYTDDVTEEQDIDSLTFMQPAKPGYCTVAEIWTKEIKERIRVHDTNAGTLEYFDADDKEMMAEINAINDERKSLAGAAGWSEEEIPLIEIEPYIDEYWYCRILAPDGTVLWEEESPYPDRLHPFTVIATPFVDGRIQGYLTDMIDHQIALNRALVLQDWIARNQIKGITMMPQELVPDGMSNQDFVQEAINIGNVYFYNTDKLKGVKPEVFHMGAVNYDATAYIQLLKNMGESSTAISGAIQGKTPYSGTSAALYAQQTANSSTPLAGLLDDLRSFQEEYATKKVKNIARFYSPERFMEIAGSMAEVFNNANLRFTDLADIEFDMSIKEGTETPVFRAAANDELLSFWQAGAIDLQTMLEVGHFPYGDSLLQKMQARQAEMQAAQQGQMGEVTRQVADNMENPVETQDYGLPVKSTREIVK